MAEKKQLPADYDVSSDLDLADGKAAGGAKDKSPRSAEPTDAEGDADPNFATNGE